MSKGNCSNFYVIQKIFAMKSVCVHPIIPSRPVYIQSNGDKRVQVTLTLLAAVLEL